MNIGFTEAEYSRVRNWLLSAIAVDPSIIDEAILLDKLRVDEWHLVTTDHAAAVLQFYPDDDGKTVCKVLLIGGEKGKALREIMRAYQALSAFFQEHNFSKITGNPRQEWASILSKYKFEKNGKEYFRELI